MALLAVTFAYAVPFAFAGPEDATAAEQWFLYDLNRARWNAAEYADYVKAEYGTNPSKGGYPMDYLDLLEPAPPLAPNPSLFAATGYKAHLTAGAGFYPGGAGSFQADWTSLYYHCSYLDGGRMWRCPNRLAKDFGYDLPSWFPLDPVSGLPGSANWIEVYWASSGSGDVPPAAVFLSWELHTQVLDNVDWRESGVGHSDQCPSGSSACRFLFVHTAYPASDSLFITGAVFHDWNKNGYMDLGEGISGASVTGAGKTVSTGIGGLYSIPVSHSGTYQVTVSGSGFPTTVATVPVHGFNSGADFWIQPGAGTTSVVHAYGLCHGLAPTLMGTEGDDALVGTSGNDVINGGGGNDIIYGGGGNDVICGGDGRDTIIGGTGNDTIYGGRARDTIKGGAGDDIISGNRGGDRIRGGDGNDVIDADKGADRVHAGDGWDLVQGNGGADTLMGDGGNDDLDGGGGTNTLDGGPGFDTCVSGSTVDCETVG